MKKGIKTKMNYFIDFEATQFDENIINVGCVCENGESFSSLVKPHRIKNITKFITDLTGITREMVEEAPSADEVFYELWRFICSTNTYGGAPKFYCYGDSDGHFIERTVHHMGRLDSIACAMMIKGLMVDYSTEVSEYFHSDRAFSLRNVFCLVNREEIIQKHDALEDAKMLQTVVENLKSMCAPTDVETLCLIPSQKKPKKNGGLPVPTYYSHWTKKKAWTGITDGNENNWTYKCTNNDNNKTQYFNSYEMATLWFLRYFAGHRKGNQSRRPSSQEHRNEVSDIIQKSLHTDEYVYSCKWEINEDRKEVEENV